jgi:ribosome biogenesis GTPase / thiamine phosphate phosphatase
MRGIILRMQSGFYTVQTEVGLVTCQLRGRLKRHRSGGDVAAIGDWVELTHLEADRGVIEEIEERQRAFVRTAPTPQGTYRQVIIANPDQAIFTFACANPEPHLGMLDRFLIVAERQGIPAVIVANKIDLVGMEVARSLFDHYPSLGYQVIYTCSKTGEGVDQLKQILVNKISFFAGPSGVGKSSLLNEVQSGLGLLVRETSQITNKGRHTTVTRQLFPLEMGGYVAYTPGLKAFAIWDIRPEELDGYFPELRQLVDQCQFSDCTHVHEPGCAVLAALEAGRIAPRRYQSYLHIRFGNENE